ncbi:MAG: DEAD/DEAH box helicase family protein [Candidatus Methanomethylophilaceae archaeon]|nr:DEAD/DEAH box helicase family protein [Candidatus Methanomethylophilaceae archaeon]
MGNFDYMLGLEGFEVVAEAAVLAERNYSMPDMCVLACRRAMEFGIKWTFNADPTLPEPSSTLASNMYNDAFQSLLDDRVGKVMNIVKRNGDRHHEMGASATQQDALASLEGLFMFLRWVNCMYISDYPDVEFSVDAIPVLTEKDAESANAELVEAINAKDAQIDELLRKVKELESNYYAERQRNLASRRFEPGSMTEYETRKMLIDMDLASSGWSFDPGAQQIDQELKLEKGPGEGSDLFADYVLYGKDGRPLAVVEAKRTCRDANDGRNQVMVYADRLERRFGRRPMMFWTNGYETYFWDDQSAPWRKVSGIFSRDDLDRLMTRRILRKDMSEVPINADIAGRWYQTAAIKKICEDIEKGVRKHLLVMATGTGKTRTAVGLFDVLSRANLVTNCLFLADRTELVSQADTEGFQRHLPSVSTCNLCENKKDMQSRVVISTYPTMMNAIDDARGEDESRVFSPAHFDLIFVDESHRSIFNKYKEILDYFDAQIVGLTATPRDEISRNTYEFFEKSAGEPSFVYEYGRAVEDGWLVPYVNIEVDTAFLTSGIHYDELSEEDRKRMEEDFDEGVRDVDSDDINRFVFNKSTIDTVLQDLMENGIKVDGGESVGKTIIFAQNKLHAEEILKRFNHLYPEYKGTFMSRVVCDDSGSKDVIKRFKRMKDKRPQVVISVDMMDTGVDVPDCVNLVFFKKVRSKIKFLQMIGRGTRLDPETIYVDAIDGEYAGKRRFLIFDYLGNFEFFRADKKTYEGDRQASLAQQAFERKVRIIQLLQKKEYQDPDHQALRKRFVLDCHEQVSELNEDRFNVQQELRYVHAFKDIGSFDDITEERKDALLDRIAPLVRSDEADVSAKRFDVFMLGLMQMSLEGTGGIARAQSKLDSTMDRLLDKLTIPQVRAKEQTIRYARSDEFWVELGSLNIDIVRQELRDLIQFIDEQRQRSIVVTDLTDPVLGRTEGVPIPEMENYEGYRRRVEKYLYDHQDMLAIRKLTHNVPLDGEDIKELSSVLVEELGSWDNYRAEYQDKGFGRLVREVLKMDRESVMAAFSGFIAEANLNSRQIDFVNKVVNNIVANGFMEVEELGEAPFDRPVDITMLFSPDQSSRIVDIINGINRNAETRGETIEA